MSPRTSRRGRCWMSPARGPAGRPAFHQPRRHRNVPHQVTPLPGSPEAGPPRARVHHDRPPAQTQPGSSSCLRCWPAPAHCQGRDGCGPVRAGPDAGRGWPEGSARHWPPGGGRRRRLGCGQGGYVIASIECSLFLVGFVFQKPLSQKHRSTFLPLQHAATLIPSVDWGLD